MKTTSKSKSLLTIASKKGAPKKWAKSAPPTTAQLVWNRIFKQMEPIEKNTLQKAS